jgi:hypothetical protein
METGIDQAHTNIDNHLADTSDAHDASAISVVASGFNGNLATTDDTVQKVAQKLDDLVIGSGSDASVHIADTTNAHAATSIDHTVTGTVLIPGSVQNALVILDGYIDDLSTADVNHLNDTSGAHAASAISVVAAGFNGNLATTDDTVQKVAQKLDDLVIGAGGTMTREEVEDLLMSSFVGAGTASVSYDDTNNRFLITGAASLTREEIEDLLASTFVAGTGISVTYSDVGNSFTITNTSPNQNLYSGSESFGISGVLSARTGKLKLYNDSGRTRTITSIRASVDSSPGGGPITIDVNKNGTTLYTTQGNRCSIAAGAFTSKSTNMNISSWEDSSYLTLDIDLVGVSIAGSDLIATVEWV